MVSCYAQLLAELLVDSCPDRVWHNAANPKGSTAEDCQLTIFLKQNSFQGRSKDTFTDMQVSYNGNSTTIKNVREEPEYWVMPIISVLWRWKLEKDHGSRPARAKSEQASISTYKPGMVVQACDPNQLHRRS
jgi:hypothetical protein